MKSGFKIVLATILLTLIVIFFGHKAIVKTGEYPFCGSCHAWDGVIAQTNLADPIHGASNQKGISVKCTDCHLPHDNIFNYLITKAKNGVAEGFTTLTKDPTKKDWIANRDYARKNYTFDSSCLRCHENVILESDGNATREVTKMHMKYVEFLNTKEQMKCTDCHKFVGHKELGKTLIEQKHQVAKTWKEWLERNVKTNK